MNRFIYLRITHDWRRIRSMSDFEAANRSSRKLFNDWLPSLKHSIEAWNSVFGVSYFAFRAALKEVSERNISKVRGAILLTRDTIWSADFGERFLLVPIDDDDWLAPDIFDMLEERRKDEDIIIWPTAQFGEKLKIHDLTKPVHNIRWAYSNNFALTEAGFRKCLDLNPTREFLEDHRMTDRLVQDHGYRRLVLAVLISAYNQSPASATKIYRPPRQPPVDLPKLIDAYQPFALPSDLEWTREYIEEVWKLIDKLRVRKLLL